MTQNLMQTNTNNTVIKAPDWWQHSQAIWLELHTALSLIDVFQASGLNKDAIYLIKNWRNIYKGNANFNYQFKPNQSKVSADLEKLNLFVQVVKQENFDKMPGGKFTEMNQILQKQSTIVDYLPHCYHETKGLRIFQWIEGENLSAYLINNENPFDSQLIRVLCEFLVKLHQIKHPALPVINIKDYLETYCHLAIKKSPESANRIQQFYNSAEVLLSYFQASVLCHHDLSAENILVNKHASNTKLIKIIDWEYAAISDAYLDLANVANNFQLSNKQESELLSVYCEMRNINLNEQKYKAMKKLSQIINQLWHF